jgi:YD repeat-containing protein
MIGASAARSSGSKLYTLDREGFDAGGYVRAVLEKDGLKELLAMENELVGEIRTLDGERKALVYDNYSKLISATDTIKKVSF